LLMLPTPKVCMQFAFYIYFHKLLDANESKNASLSASDASSTATVTAAAIDSLSFFGGQTQRQM